MPILTAVRLVRTGILALVVLAMGSCSAERGATVTVTVNGLTRALPTLHVTAALLDWLYMADVTNIDPQLPRFPLNLPIGARGLLTVNLIAREGPCDIGKGYGQLSLSSEPAMALSIDLRVLPGICNGECTSGNSDCNFDKLTDGCETNTASDFNNCGTCRNACSTNHIGALSCTAGTCSGVCSPGYEDCNNDKRTDGCETSTNDIKSCGGCAKECSPNHIVTVTCAAGVCNGACAAGFSDCNDDKQSDGCESNLSNDVNHCGTCATRCAAGFTCESGKCHAKIGTACITRADCIEGPVVCGMTGTCCYRTGIPIRPGEFCGPSIANGGCGDPRCPSNTPCLGPEWCDLFGCSNICS